MKKVAESDRFSLFIAAVIIVNTILMASEYHKMEPEHELFLSICNIFITAIFTIEMIIKLIGLGIKLYVSDGFNIFDGIMVIISLMEILIFPEGGSNYSGLLVLRAFRLFRVFKLARGWI